MSERGDGPDEPPRVLLRAGGPVDSCSACLRFFGDDLDPDAVTAALGSAPTDACRMGDVARRKVTTRVERHGKWLLDIDHRAGASVEELVNELLDRVTDDLAVWADLTGRFQADLFCGIHLEVWNRGVSLSPLTLRRVADRGLELGLDIYFVGDGEAG